MDQEDRNFKKEIFSIIRIKRYTSFNHLLGSFGVYCSSVPLQFLLIGWVFFVFTSTPANAQITTGFKNKELPLNTSLAEFCKNEPEAVSQFFDQVNLDYPGLEITKQAVSENNLVQACSSLASYYTLRKKNNWLIHSKDSLIPGTYLVAADALDDVYTFQDVKGKLPKLSNGKRNWYYNGPKQDVEWAYFLNRHFFLNDLSNAYQKNNDVKYATCYNNLLMDWITSNPAKLAYTHNQTWRPLEAGIRVGRSWVKSFFDFQHAKEFTDLTRVLMLISFFEHANYLQNFHGKHHNHAVSELISLSKIALNFPEFKKAGSWYDEAVKGIQEEFVYSAYPDGAIKELTSHYHSVVTREFTEFIYLNNEFGKTLPLFFSKTLENMYNYLAATARPDGMGLLNNDSDLDNNFDFIKSFNTVFKRPDWDYIISNGKSGKVPGQISQMFPWAGHFIMRNGYGEKPGKDHFAYFDIGPWGTTHQHNDKLHFSLFANGRELLCDNGRMYYKSDSIRSYFNLSVGHNVIALDDKGQNESKETNTQPVDPSVFSIQQNVDFAMGTYQDGFGDSSRNSRSWSMNKKAENIQGKHTRAVIYLKDKYWIIIDRVETDRPRKLKALWHFNPDCNVKKSNNTVFSDDAHKSNVLIHPVGKLPWAIQLIKGQDSPYVQGWYSEIYNKRQPAYCAEYSTMQTKNTATFAWIMYPSANQKLPVISTRLLDNSAGAFRFEINIDEGLTTEVAINMEQMDPIKLSGNRTLTGRCSILQKGKAPIVIHGKITDNKGQVIAIGK
ncbi:MAG: alginate lyase family protein [Ferruginibacter sp.]|nr:alginate lyase family protein [Ferruginibacter sp.]